MSLGSHVQSIQSLFQKQVLKRPDSTALIFKSHEYCYKDVDELTNRVAHGLIASGVKTEDFVALSLKRSAEMIFAMLGILKAGAAYLPIDPSYPDSRKHNMIQDSNARFMVCDPRHDFETPAGSCRVLMIHDLINENLKASLLSHPPGWTNKKPAFVIYTSGSTGQPKGVVLHHGGAVNLAKSVSKILDIGPSTRYMHFASLGFDASTFDWLLPLCSGSTVIVVPEMIRKSGERL